MPQILSYKIANSLYLVCHRLDSHDKQEAAKPVEVPTDHIMIWDCSGSMSWDLPKIREQVKKKLPKMLKEGDTFSGIWFSGRGQSGILLEKEPVATLKDLQDVEKAVDRWLKPVGLTGFKEPLEKAIELADKLGGKGRAVSVIFMSDGCDNQWPRAEILKAIEKLAPKISSSTFVEYGYYADRPLLTAMAEKAGGALIFAEDFVRYEPAFEAAMTKKASGAKRIEVSIQGDPLGGFAFSLVDGDLVTFSASSGTVAVPEDIGTLFYLSSSRTRDELASVEEITRLHSLGKISDHEAIFGSYAAVSLFAIRMKPDIVYPLLKALGDVQLIEQFSSCFGKQKYSAFMEDAKGLAFKKEGRWAKGWDPNKVPRDDAFTVLDVLELLQQDEKARVLLDDPNFKYSKIGRGRIDTSGQLSEADLEELRKLTDALSKEKDVRKIKDLNAKIAAFTDGKSESLRFVVTPQPNGYPFLKLTFNEDRPNVSILTKKPGTIDLSPRLPTHLVGKVPEVIDTYVFRNYAIIKDGLVNVDKLPVRISAASHKLLVQEGIRDAPLSSTDETVDLVLDLKALPVINRKMIKNSLSAKTFFETQYELTRAQAAQKVFNGYAAELLPEKKSVGFAEKFGGEAAEWLKQQGITDYKGWGPPSTKVEEAKDFYLGKELKASLKGLSTLPSLKEVREKIQKGSKLNMGGLFMADTLRKIESFLASDAYTKAAAKDNVLQAWLDGEKKAATETVRKFIFIIAQSTFVIIVGQTWFTEFSSLDEGSLDIDKDGQKIACKVEMKDIEIKI